jgi:hypothetical protein
MSSSDRCHRPPSSKLNNQANDSKDGRAHAPAIRRRRRRKATPTMTSKDKWMIETAGGFGEGRIQISYLAWGVNPTGGESRSGRRSLK